MSFLSEYKTPLVIVVAGLIIGAAVYFSRGASQPVSSPAPEIPPAPTPAKPQVDSGQIKQDLPGLIIASTKPEGQSSGDWVDNNHLFLYGGNW